MSPLYFFLKNLATFFSRQFCGVTPDDLFDDLFCSSLYHFSLLSLRCHPLEGVTLHLFYLSDLVSPLFFVHLPTIFFSFGCHPLEGVTLTRGGPPRSLPPSDTTASLTRSGGFFNKDAGVSTHSKYAHHHHLRLVRHAQNLSRFEALEAVLFQCMPQ